MFNLLAFLGLVVLGGTFIVFEILIPLFKGTRLFPSFRRERVRIQDEITDKREKSELSDMKRRAKSL